MLLDGYPFKTLFYSHHPTISLDETVGLNSL